MQIILIILLLDGIYFFFSKQKKSYRLKVYDQLNGQFKWVTHVDGINGTFTYSSNPDVAILYQEQTEAERIAKLFVDEHTTFIIKKGMASVTMMSNTLTSLKILP